MKKLTFAIIFLLTHTLFGFEDAQIESIVNNNQGVYLLINDAWLKTEGLQVLGENAFALVEGEWITLQEAVQLGDFQAAWKCSKCKRYNMDGVNTCPYCGRPKNA
jgi:hypothetical protein